MDKNIESEVMAHQHIKDEIPAGQGLLHKNEVNTSDLKEVMAFVRRWRKTEVIMNLAPKAVRYLNLWGALEKVDARHVVESEVHWARHGEVQLMWVTWETWMGIGDHDEETQLIKDYNWSGVVTSANRAMELPWGAKWRRDLPYPRLGFWKNLHFEVRCQLMRVEKGFLPEDTDGATQNPEEVGKKNERLMRANVYLDIILKRLWMLPMSMAGKDETPAQIWGRMVRLMAHALSALLGETLCGVEGEGVHMHVVAPHNDGEPPRGEAAKWKMKLVKLMEEESCHLQKDVMGRVKTSNYWEKETNVFDDLVDDLGINYRNIGLG